MTTLLGQKTLSGIFWSFVERVGNQLIGVVSSIILARLLLPAHFGLVAMIKIFTEIGTTLVNSGFGAALIQKKNISQEDTSSVFYFNVITSLIFALTLFFSAPLIAQFYRTPELINITRIISLNLILNGLNVVHYSLLNKNMQFNTLTKITLASNAVSSGLGIFLAWKGFGVWSLVVSSVTLNFINTLLMWIIHPWKPSWLFNFRSLKSMFSYGSRILLSGIFITIFNNIYSVIIGKYFSAAQLGFYSKAKNLTNMAVGESNSIIKRILFPAFASIQDQPERLKHNISKSCAAVSTLHFPLAFGLIVVMPALVKVLLTDKWLPAVPFCQLLLLATLFEPISYVYMTVLKSIGRSGLFLHFVILSRVLTIIAILITFRWGIKGLIYGQIAVQLITFLYLGHYMAKLTGYSRKRQLSDVWPSFLASGVMATAIWLWGKFVSPFGLSITLIAQIIGGVFLYILLVKVWKTPGAVHIEELVKPSLVAFRQNAYRYFGVRP